MARCVARSWPARGPVVARSGPFRIVRDLKSLAVSPERAILELLYGIETYESYLWSHFQSPQYFWDVWFLHGSELRLKPLSFNEPSKTRRS